MTDQPTRDQHERNNHVLERAIEDIKNQVAGAGQDPLVGAVISSVDKDTPDGPDKKVLKRIKQDHRDGHVTRDDLETVQRINRDNEAFQGQDTLRTKVPAAGTTRDPNDNRL
jgi:hypothetical protein